MAGLCVVDISVPYVSFCKNCLILLKVLPTPSSTLKSNYCLEMKNVPKSNVIENIFQLKTSTHRRVVGITPRNINPITISSAKTVSSASETFNLLLPAAAHQATPNAITPNYVITCFTNCNIRNCRS